MRSLKMIGALVCAVLVFCSCTQNADSTSDETGSTVSSQTETSGNDVKKSSSAAASDPEKQNEPEKQQAEPVQNDGSCDVEGAGEGIALVSIQTKDTSKDAIKFATEPVAEHVSKSRASWDWSYKVPDVPYYEACTVTVKDADGNTVIDGADADVKVRGNWTTMYDKKPFRIKFNEKQSMLGLNDGAEMKNWLLLGEYKDFSMLRNKAAFDIAEDILGADGYYSSDCEFVEVVINGRYWGVYLLAEQQQINKNRVDITEAEENYEGTDIGYFMEFDGYYVNEEKLQQFYVSYNGNAPLVPYDGKGGSGKTIECLRGGSGDVGITIKSDIYSQEQHDFIANYVNNVYKILYEAAYNDKAFVFDDDYNEITETTEITPREAVEAVIDVQSLVDSYILCEIACDADIYWSSFFMDVDFGEGGNKKLTFEAPWDFDSALGNKNRCASGEGFYAANIVKDVNDQYKTINPWLAVLLKADWYEQLVKERFAKAYDDGVFDRVIEELTTVSQTYEEAFTRNYERWDNIRNNGAANELCAAAKRCKTQMEAAEYLASWLTTRIAFLHEAWK